MSDTPPTEPIVESAPDAANPQEPTTTPEPTVGTGTAMALGCIGGTLVLIAFGLIFIFFATIK